MFPPEKSLTTRQQIVELLSRQALDARGLSQQVSISEREVYSHLPHIDRSLKTGNRRLLIHPAICLDCHHLFKRRSRFTPPGRCPSCRGTHLQSPRYEIR